MDGVLDEAVVGLPDPRLRPYVDRYLGYREHAARPLVRREVAGAFVVLVLAWGAPLDVDRAKAVGAEIVREPFDTAYGSRDHVARDLAGNVWSFGTYRRD